MTVDEFLGQLDRVRKTGRGWSASCPAHEDRSPSLAVSEGDDGRVLLRCFAGCTADKITAALGLRLADLFPGTRDQYANAWRPATPEERQATENVRLRRKVRALERERRCGDFALHRASILIAIAYSDDHEGVLDRLWRGAVHTLEAEAAAEADAHGVEVAA